MANGEDESSLPPITGPGRGKASPGAAPTIEGYQITEPLGEGGMGTVWRAVQLSTRREVALKLMTNEAFASKKARARFQREVELAARLQHTNIARIHDSGLHRGVYYYVMELVEGVPLDRYVKENRLGQKEILRLVRTVCQALQHAHQRGVIHRDLKPTNILVTADGQPHLLDFGLAKAFLEADSGASATDFGETVGTPGYMSPEQVRGEKTDSRTDIFAVGVVWYELLAGTRPFDGKMPGEILSSILTREPVSIDLLRPDVATDFRQVIHKCLRKEPDLRYQDMDDLLVDLKHLENVLESWEAVGSKKPKSVAVLLFLNLSGEPADEYLCEGLSEDITTDLSKIHDLTVVSRWLAKSRQSRGLDVCSIGKELEVDSVLQGSVQRVGKRLRVSVQLINAANGFHLWAEKFDRQMEDIFAVQDEIAVATARALQLRLTGMDREPRLRRGTESSEAYEEFIKGRFHYWYRNTAADVEASERHYRRALELDPSYAQAWVGLADIYNMLWVRGSPRRKGLVEESREALARAEKIDPALPYGCYTRAWHHAAAGDILLAEKILLEGLAENPEDPALRCTLGMFNLSRGEIERAADDLTAALRLDPFFHIANVYLSVLEAWYRRDFRKAVAHLDEVLGFAPDFCHALRAKAKWCLLQGHFEEALTLLQRAAEVDRPWAYHLATEAIVLAHLKRPEEARAKIQEAVAENPVPTWGVTDQTQAVNTTIAFSSLQELDEASEWLEKTAEVFLNSYNPRLFDILDALPGLESLRLQRRYKHIKKDHLSRAAASKQG